MGTPHDASLLRPAIWSARREHAERPRSKFRTTMPPRFGLFRPNQDLQSERLAAATRVARFLRIGGDAVPTPEDFSIVKGMFTRVRKTDQPDWFTVMVQLGMPSMTLCGALSNSLRTLRRHYLKEEADEAESLRQDLLLSPLATCLDVFLGRTRLPREPGSGWVYVVSRRGWPDSAMIGTTSGSLASVIEGLHRESVGPFFGLHACWRVTDAMGAYPLIENEFAGHRRGNEPRFFRVTPTAAIKRTAALLSEAAMEIRTETDPGALAPKGATDAWRRSSRDQVRRWVNHEGRWVRDEERTEAQADDHKLFNSAAPAQ